MGLKHTEVCSIEDCYMPYYARWLCKKHYKQKLGKEGAYKREYLKKKKDPKYKEMKRKSDKKYREKLKKAGILSKKQKEYYKKWIAKKGNLQKKRQSAKKYNQRLNFDRNREKAIQRDGESCVNCGITREEHKEKYGFDIHVHHKDGRGYGVEKESKNSKLKNLVTLCASCHRKVDAGTVVLE